MAGKKPHKEFQFYFFRRPIEKVKKVAENVICSVTKQSSTFRIFKGIFDQRPQATLP